MNKYLMAAFAATLALVSMSAFPKDVDLTDQDRMDLRQRVDGLRSENALGRGREEGMRDQFRGANVKPAKAKHGKRHGKRHAKRGHGKRRA
ncbi:MAG TPA: hypothetical protein VM164_07205 [Burkholderiales bacterium]|nr:hypothetical protein [Burkholderiales bacterium]